MRILSLPSDQLLRYEFTGKFKAPSADWKHENLFLGDYELFVMTEGTLYLSYNEERFTVQSGEYLLLPPCNSWRQGFKSAFCSFYWLHFSVEPPRKYPPPHISRPLDIPQNASADVPPGKELYRRPEMLHGSDGPFSLPQSGAIPKLEKMVVLMKQLQDSVKSNYPVVTLDAMTTNILTELYGQLCLNAPVENRTLTQKQVYSDIVDYIQLHIAENLRVKDIARHFGYNSKYLSHLFTEITGAPLKQFIMNRKIETANFMLTDTNSSITDIAKGLGFTDSHNFARAYKKITGLTPSEYRNTFAKRLLYHV